MSEYHSQAEIEAALFGNGWTILEKNDNLTTYQTNFQPGADLAIDWSRGKCEWKDIEEQLIYQCIDPQPIYDDLPQSKP